jgi:hypothetical protein
MAKVGLSTVAPVGCGAASCQSAKLEAAARHEVGLSAISAFLASPPLTGAGSGPGDPRSRVWHQYRSCQKEHGRSWVFDGGVGREEASRMAGLAVAASREARLTTNSGLLAPPLRRTGAGTGPRRSSLGSRALVSVVPDGAWQGQGLRRELPKAAWAGSQTDARPSLPLFRRSWTCPRLTGAGTGLSGSCRGSRVSLPFVFWH